jgi:DNA repair photolyase
MDIPRVLEREIRNKKRGVVGVSTVTDPYQPVEAKLCLTRSCLEVLLSKNFPVCIQTKSSLVLRDLDLIRQFKDAEVGLTITTLDGELSNILEPGASPPSARLKALKSLADEGIVTWAFIGPIVPGVLDKDRLPDLLTAVKETGISRVMLDKLRLKPGMWARIEQGLNERSPEVLEECRRMLFNNDRAFSMLKPQVQAICEDIGLRYELNY